MTNEVTVIPTRRTKVALLVVLEPIEVPMHLVAYDASGGEHHLSPAALDVETLEHLAANFRARLLNEAGYSTL